MTYMTNHAEELKEAGEAYQQARAEAERILTPPRERLASAARAAYKAGAKKSEILRWMGHAWTGTWLDRVLQGTQPPPGTIRRTVRDQHKGKK